MSNKTTILEWARAAKRANEASGEEVIRDELLIRAATSWMLMKDSLGFLESVLPRDSRARDRHDRHKQQPSQNHRNGQ